MLRRLLIAISVFLSIASYGKKHYDLLPSDFAGSMMTYDFSYTQSEPIWPDSLKPVYVARVARHGARYISSHKKLEHLQNAISKASAAGTLTKEGQKFSALLKSVEDATGGQWGRLSEVGCREEERLADDLYALLPDLMKNARVNAISTYVPRVVMTMYQFNHELTALSSDIDITASEGKQFNYLLRCFTEDPAYSSYRDYGDWKKVSKQLMDSIVSPEPARRLFGIFPGLTLNGHFPELADYKLRELTLDIYDVLQSLTAFGMPAPTDEFMSAADYRACWEVDNLEHYLRNTINPLSSLAGKASTPLLARIIADADASLNSRLLDLSITKADMKSAEIPARYDANFYFGHAETLMPLLSLMRVPGCYSDSSDFTTLYESWRDYDVVPLGANLDIIFLESAQGSVYIALRHNGYFVTPIPGSHEKIVDWNVYRSFLTGIMMEVASK